SSTTLSNLTDKLFRNSSFKGSSLIHARAIILPLSLAVHYRPIATVERALGNVSVARPCDLSALRQLSRCLMLACYPPGARAGGSWVSRELSASSFKPQVKADRGRFSCHS